MSATTINRTTAAVTDDDGSLTTGTVWNNAWYQLLCNAIDALYTASATWQSTGTIVLNVYATTAGTSTLASVKIGTDIASDHTGIYSFSSTYTTSGINKQGGTLLEAKGVGGLTFAADHSSGQIFFYTGGTPTKWTVLDNNGHWIYTEVSSNPSAADLTSGANVEDRVALYMKSDKLVFAYNRTGTVTYLTVPLDGATTTWTQTTVAP